jgi:hypothetical protein
VATEYQQDIKAPQCSENHVYFLQQSKQHKQVPTTSTNSDSTAETTAATPVKSHCGDHTISTRYESRQAVPAHTTRICSDSQRWVDKHPDLVIQQAHQTVKTLKSRPNSNKPKSSWSCSRQMRQRLDNRLLSKVVNAAAVLLVTGKRATLSQYDLNFVQAACNCVVTTSASASGQSRQVSNQAASPILRMCSSSAVMTGKESPYNHCSATGRQAGTFHGILSIVYC